MSDAHLWRGAQWWRCEGYEVFNGTHIRPAEDEWETYNPLEEHLELWEQKKELQPCYVELSRLDLEDADTLAQWCGGCGLLGIMSHRLSVAYVWPRKNQAPLAPWPWYSRERDLDVIGDRLAGKVDTVDHPGEPFLDLPLEAVLPEPIDEPRQYPPYAVIAKQDADQLIEVDLVEGVSQFFPEIDPVGITEYVNARKAKDWSWRGLGRSQRDLVSERIRKALLLGYYPTPFTSEFQTSYSEPIDLFREYAARIKNRLEMLEIVREQLSQGRSISELLRRKPKLVSDLAGFKATLRATAPTLQVTAEGGLAMSWRTSSLYAAMHIMMLLDYTNQGRYWRSCSHKSCRNLFVTRYKTKEYCSEKCQRTAQVYRRRKRMKLGKQGTGA